MPSTEIGGAIRVARMPIHPTLMCFPIACFVGTLLTDIAYWQTADMLWSDFSSWLIAVGVILAWVSAILGLIDMTGHRYAPDPRLRWAYRIGNLIVLVLATLNAFVHTHDAWTSVMPWGLTLSILTVVVLIVTAPMGWASLYRRELVAPVLLAAPGAGVRPPVTPQVTP